MRNKLIVLIIITIIFAGTMAAAAEVEEDIAVVQKVMTTYHGYWSSPYIIYYPVQLEKPGLLSVYFRPVKPELPFEVTPTREYTFRMMLMKPGAFLDLNDDKWNDWLNDIEGSVPEEKEGSIVKYIIRDFDVKDSPRQINYGVDYKTFGMSDGRYIIRIDSKVSHKVESILTIRYPGSRHYFDPEVDSYRRNHPDLIVDNVTLDHNNNLEVHIKNIGAIINQGYWHLKGEKAVTLIVDIEGRKYGVTLPGFDPEMKLREQNQLVSYTFDTIKINNETEVKVTIDENNIMIEKNEDNNEKVIKIAGTGQAGNFKIEPLKIPLNTSFEIENSNTKPDLIVQAISLNDQNETIIELKNSGEGNIDQNLWDESNVILHLKKDGNSWADIYKSSFDPNNELINPGGSLSFNTGFKLNQDTTIKASIDDSDVIDEADENNNVMEVSLQL